jgi:shikimate kinase
MHLSFIGMSNIGKSYWSSRLADEEGYKRFCCDELISKKLNVSNLTDWLGQPPEEKYIQNSKVYLDSEKLVMEEVLKITSESNEPVCSSNIIIDTSGSVIYLDENILEKLSYHSVVIYLEASEKYKTEMLEKYETNPKPLIWSNSKDYFELLDSRSKLYKKLAHITIPFEVHRDENMKASTLLEYIVK